MDLNVEGKTMKLFEGNIDLGLDRDFLDMTSKHSPQNTQKINTFHLIKIKNVCASKGIIKKIDNP